MSSKITLLSDLCHLEYDAVAAYEETLEKIKEDNLKRTIAAFCKEHREHIVNLNELLEQNDAQKVTNTDLKEVLTKGKVMIAAMINDKAILEAMHMNENVTTEAYEKALKNDQLTISERAVIEKHYEDEKLHKDWFAEMVQKR
ncbi:DUF892 family protein [Alteromonas ponticola]|uniref:DUF892 family protein n=1 Tax=Alteromonas ponticola TaxID=2720613 RepID=A0ABX1R5Q8_9ALTE|nr:DUF892 family protein [Alteromonas ponticola]